MLAWIEGELDPEAAARLEADPRLRAILHELRSHRDLLRSSETPTPPMDFLAATEAQLVRPMLIDDRRPGAFRRDVHRPRHRATWLRRSVAAAAITLLAGGLVVLLLEAVPRLGDLIPRTIDQRVEVDDLPKLVPPPSTSRLVGVREPEPPGGEPIPVAAAPAPVEDVRLALLVAIESPEALESLMLDILLENPDRVAFVRNVTWDEIHAIERRPRLATTDSLSTTVASGNPQHTGEPMPGPGDDPIALDLAMGADEPLPGMVLLGHAAMGPGYQQQLKDASAGAGWTISLPIASLSDLLERLDEATQQRTRLILLDENFGRSGGLAAWRHDLPRIHRTLQRWRAAAADARLQMPVVWRNAD